MASWQFVVGPAREGQTAALTTAVQRKVTFKLTQPSEASFSISGRSPEAGQIEELLTDLHVLRDGRLLYRGRIGPTSDTLDGTSHTVAVQTLDYREVLNRRIFYQPWTYTQQDQGVAAWLMVDEAQQGPGYMDIGRGVGQTSGIVRDYDFAGGDSIGGAIQSLAEISDGFDWDLTPTDPVNLNLDLWHRHSRGTDRGVFLDYGSTITSLQRSVPVDTYANSIRVSGANDTLVEWRQAPSLSGLAAPPEGQWDMQFGFPEITSAAKLAARADWQIADAQVIRPAYTATLTGGAWDGPDHIWLGDPVRLRVRSGRIDIDTTLRVYEIGVDLPGSGEQVQLTLGAPAPDYRRRPTDFAKRLRNLERR
jgi:hypothetical protein